VGLQREDPGLAELVAEYNKWRLIYGYAGVPAPNEADWEGDRLFFRFGFPHPDWWAYVLDAGDNRLYSVIRVSTERTLNPVESARGKFSRIQDAGKFMIYEVAESLRINCRLDPLSWKWDDAGLDPRVDTQIESDRVVKYFLRENPDAYFVMTRGDMPYSHILPLSYGELDALLLEGFPASVVSRVNAE
jgi:hypothetical protein